MKILAILLIIYGIIAFIGAFLISTYSEELSDFWKTFAMVFAGYTGLIAFTYGWMILFRKSK